MATLSLSSRSSGMNYTECEEDPIHLPPDFDGHAYPGLAGIFVAAIFYWVVLSRYYKSVAPNSTYNFDGRFATRLAVPGLPMNVSAGVLGFFVLLAILTGSTLELLFVYHKTIAETITALLMDPHSPLAYSYMVFSIVSTMEARSSLKVPENASQLALTFMSVTWASIAYGHLVTRCPFDVELHTITIFLPALTTTICLGAQLLMPSSFLLAAGACFGIAMSGVGLVMIGVIGFKFRRYSWWMEMSTGQKMRKIPLYFFDVSALVFGIFVLVFYLFGKLRGDRLGIQNPDYTAKRSMPKNYEEDPAGYGELTALLVKDAEA